MKKLRVVQIGTAHDHAGDHMDTMRFLSDDYEVVGVCEPDEALRAAAKQRISWDGKRMIYDGLCWLSIAEVLDIKDLDAAVIETCELELVKYAQLLADKGVAIHMDKPGGDDYPAFKRLVDTLRIKGLPLQIGYMYRYNEAVKYCRKLKASGAFGEIFSVEAQMSVQHDKQKRIWLKQFKGGMMFFLGCHLVDIIYMMCGEPEEIIPCNCSTGNDGLDCEDFGFVLFRYKNGLSFAKTCASEINGFGRRQIIITGTKATVAIEPIEERVDGPNVNAYSIAHITFREEGESVPFSVSGKDVSFGPAGRYLDMMQDFARMVRGEIDNPYTYDYELAVQRLLLKACGYRIDS